MGLSLEHFTIQPRPCQHVTQCDNRTTSLPLPFSLIDYILIIKPSIMASLECIVQSCEIKKDSHKSTGPDCIISTIINQGREQAESIFHDRKHDLRLENGFERRYKLSINHDVFFSFQMRSTLEVSDHHQNGGPWRATYGPEFQHSSYGISATEITKTSLILSKYKVLYKNELYYYTILPSNSNTKHRLV